MLEDLHAHLICDFRCCGENDKLIIIDDYNCQNISDEAIQFYKKQFKDSGIKNIEIYFQVESIPESIKTEFEKVFGPEQKLINKILAFLVLTYTKPSKFMNSIIGKNNIKFDSIVSKIEKVIDPIINFIEEMESIRINVTYHPYASLGVKPPFHGRYWLGNNAGYIVDGSLNTWGRKLVLAQLMDNVNYEIIDSIYKNDIIPNCQQSSVLDKDKIIELKRLIINKYIY